jgi:predicted transcriptional regulator
MQKHRARRHVVLPVKGDTAIAFKIVALMLGLTATDRRAIAALLDHFNRKTGQCDPSIETIAALLNIDRSSVIRAFRRAVKFGLFRKDRHGGHLNRNSYQPIWSRFREIDAEWQAQRKARRRCLDDVKLPPPTCSSGYLDGGRESTQTCQINIFKRTCAPDSQRRQQQGQPTEGRLATEIPSGSPAMRAAAERRWTQALNRKFASSPPDYARIIEGIDTKMQEAATDAEMLSPGGGIAYLMSAVGGPSARTHSDTLSTDEVNR